MTKLSGSRSCHNVLQRTADDRIPPSNQCCFQRRAGAQQAFECGKFLRGSAASLTTREAATDQTLHSASCNDPYRPNVRSIVETTPWLLCQQHRVNDPAIKIMEHHAQSIELIGDILPSAGHSEKLAKRCERVHVTTTQFIEVRDLP